MKICYSTDWLSVYLTFNGDKPKLLQDSAFYRLVCQPYGTRHFAKLYEVYDGVELFGEIQLFPHSTIIPWNAAIMKINNKVLYTDKFVQQIKDFCKMFDFTFEHITRLDICADFNRFANGWHPKSFIRRLLAKDVLKNRQSGYTLQGNTSKTTDFSYIRFGSRDNPICTYLYDKTKELNEVKMKKWIVTRWRAYGINENDAWRYEISIKTEGMKYVNQITGELQSVTLDDLQTQQSLQRLYNIYARQYINFKHNDGQKNKSRMKDVQLFSIGDIEDKPIRISNTVAGTRMDKILLKKMEKIINDNVQIDDFDVRALNTAQYLVARQAGLTEYLTKYVKTALSCHRINPPDVADIANDFDFEIWDTEREINDKIIAGII